MKAGESKYSSKQIHEALKAIDEGRPILKISRELKIPARTLYEWKYKDRSSVQGMKQVKNAKPSRWPGYQYKNKRCPKCGHQFN